MSLPGLLFQFGLKHLFDATSKEAVEWIDSRFEDSSRAVLRAIFDANRRSWDVIGLALAEPTAFGRVRDLARDGALKAARNEIRKLLAEMPAEQRARAAEELVALHERHRSAAGDLEGAAADLKRFSDPAGVAREADRAAGAVADTLANAPNLVAVLQLTPDGRTPLFQTVYRHFFRKRVSKNAELSGLLLHDQLRALTETTDGRTAGILEQIDTLFDALADLSQQVAGVDAKVGAGFADVTQQLADIHRIVEQVAARKKSTGFTECSEDELQELHAKLFELRCHSISVNAQQLEEIGDDLTEIELFDEARQVYTQAANATTDTATESANHYKAYLNACSVANWPLALESLTKAVAIDGLKYQPFPFDRYELIRVLGGGAFGTVFLCRDLSIDEEVAIKSLRAESLSRKPEELFKEAKTLHALKNANIIGIKNQWFADIAKTRPYFVLEYFDGETLDKLGVLAVADVIAIALQAARALQAAHAAGVFHRDFKLANVMAKKEADLWLVKVIDFGLALPAGARAKSQKNTKDKSVTGTLDFAPPEQTGELKAPVGSYSDVFAFGKTFIRVLFGVPVATRKNWNTLPHAIRDPLQELLESCIQYYPQDREQNFEKVLTELAKLQVALTPQEEELPTAELVEEEVPTPPRPVVRPVVVPPPESRAQRYQRFKDQALQKNAEARLCVENCDFAEAVEVLEGFASEELLHRDESLLADAKTKRDRLADLNSKIEAALRGDKSLHDQLETLLTESLTFDPRNKDWRELHKTCEAERKQREEAAEAAARERKAKEEAAERERKAQEEAERRKREEEEAKRNPLHPKHNRVAGKTKDKGTRVSFDLGSGVNIAFAWCPPGSFQMGGTVHDAEKPVHKVTLTKGFFMGIHPVTQAQWKAVMTSNPDPSHFKGANRPVEQVSWTDAAEFCAQLTAILKGRGLLKDGMEIRLPSEAQWEYSCRAGTTTDYWCGNSEADLARAGWYNGNSGSQTRPVGEKEANPWGLYDVHGNVWEWCSDWYGPYAASDQSDPQGNSNGDARVLRGGSWALNPVDCRAAYRYRNAPANRDDYIGFRACFRLD